MLDRSRLMVDTTKWFLSRMFPKKHGYKVAAEPQLKQKLGIQAARTIFGKCYFDAEKCFDAIQALRHYRYEADKAHPDSSGKPGLRKEPLHDWASHAADAFRRLWSASRNARKSRRSG